MIKNTILKEIEDRIEELQSEMKRYESLASDEYFAEKSGDHNKYHEYWDTHDVIYDQVEFLLVLIEDIKGVI